MSQFKLLLKCGRRAFLQTCLVTIVTLKVVLADQVLQEDPHCLKGGDCLSGNHQVMEAINEALDLANDESECLICLQACGSVTDSSVVHAPCNLKTIIIRGGGMSIGMRSLVQALRQLLIAFARAVRHSIGLLLLVY